MRRPLPPLVAVLSSLLIAASPGSAQDIKPEPEDVEAVRALLQRATEAIKAKDAKAFVSCCDVFVDCFFYDGTHVKGSRRIEETLGEFFAMRPEGAVIVLDPVPRSYRVLGPDIMMVDWPATLRGPAGELTVNTLTTLRKVDGEWSITSFLESVPFTPPGRDPSPD